MKTFSQPMRKQVIPYKMGPYQLEVGLQLTCRGHNPSCPFIRPFTWAHNAIYNDPRGPSCRHFAILHLLGAFSVSLVDGTHDEWQSCQNNIITTIVSPNKTTLVRSIIIVTFCPDHIAQIHGTCCLVWYND